LLVILYQCKTWCLVLRAADCWCLIAEGCGTMCTSVERSRQNIRLRKTTRPGISWFQAKYYWNDSQLGGSNRRGMWYKWGRREIKGLQDLGATSDGKNPIGITRWRWEDNIITDLKKIFNSLPSVARVLKNDMAKFKAALIYLHTYGFYSVDELSMYKDES